MINPLVNINYESISNTWYALQAKYTLEFKGNIPKPVMNIYKTLKENKRIQKALNCLSVCFTHSFALPSCLDFSVDYIKLVKFEIFVLVAIISPNFAYPGIKTGFGTLKIWNIISEVTGVTAGANKKAILCK